jgi:hypothetical protein
MVANPAGRSKDGFLMSTCEVMTKMKMWMSLLSYRIGKRSNMVNRNFYLVTAF